MHLLRYLIDVGNLCFALLYLMMLEEKLAGLTAFALASGESRQPLIKKL